MYGNGAAAAGGAAALPFTGIEVGWMILAGVMLVVVGSAVWRLIPRTEA